MQCQAVGVFLIFIPIQYMHTYIVFFFSRLVFQPKIKDSLQPHNESVLLVTKAQCTEHCCRRFKVYLNQSPH
jgi:hypothetical protein